MGHHVGNKSSIIPLIDRLNKYPVGLPDSPTLRQILGLLYSEQEAFIASRFPLEEATLAELAQKTAIAPQTLKPQLDRMAEKGLLIDIPYEGETYYLLAPGLIGFFELTFMKVREDLPQAEVARLIQHYIHENPRGGMAAEFFASKTPLTRALTYEDRIPANSQVTSYETARSIIEQADYGAVGLCYCRHQKHHLQQPCAQDAPLEEICISLGNAARFLVRRGFAEEKSSAELLAVIDQARAKGLIQITDNIREQPAFICNCCACCCEILAGLKMGYPAGIGKSPFLIQLDRERCTGCGLCRPSCPVAALQQPVAHEKIQLATQLCLGCGACLSSCPQQALALAERPEKPLPPKNREDMMKRRLLERKRATPFVLGRLKKKIKGLFTSSSTTTPPRP